MKKDYEFKFVGIILSIYYLSALFILFVLKFDLKKIDNGKYISILSIKTTLVSILFLIIAIIIMSNGVKGLNRLLRNNLYHKNLLEEEKKRGEAAYTWREVTIETTDCLEVLSDIVLSIIIPLFIAYYFFVNKNNNIPNGDRIEQIGATITLFIMPTFILLKLIKLAKAIFIPLYQLVVYIYKVIESYVMNQKKEEEEHKSKTSFFLIIIFSQLWALKLTKDWKIYLIFTICSMLLSFFVFLEPLFINQVTKNNNDLHKRISRKDRKDNIK